MCNPRLTSNFTALSVVLFSSALLSHIIMSGGLFYVYYVKPTYKQWTRKTNPKYPSPAIVRNEILQMLKGLSSGIICPAASIYLSGKGYSNAVCYEGNFEWIPAIKEFVVIWLISDFFEFFYHWCGHYFSYLWQHHKPHHKFNNPTPFAVISDEHLDMFIRASPLLWMPFIAEVHMELMFFQYVVFFYGYGTYLHWGFEFDWLPADNRFINTAYHHNLHHAISHKNLPYHCGFFFKIWDQLFGSIYNGDKYPDVVSEREAGNRTQAQYDEVEKPDYSPLLRLSFWVDAFKSSTAKSE